GPRPAPRLHQNSDRRRPEPGPSYSAAPWKPWRSGRTGQLTCSLLSVRASSAALEVVPPRDLVVHLIGTLSGPAPDQAGLTPCRIRTASGSAGSASDCAPVSPCTRTSRATARW